jgi:hypothetical protein
LDNGVEVLTLDNNKLYWPQITNNWKSKAIELTRVYRRDILGEEIE